MIINNDKIGIIFNPSSAGNTLGFGQPNRSRLTVSILSFSSDKFYLGKLCRGKHEWGKTGKTLRRKCNSECPECRKNRYLQQIKQDPDFNKKRYKRSNKPSPEQQRQYRQENSEKISRYNQEYRQENRDKLIKYNREYYQNNKESLLLKSKKYHQRYYAENKEKVRKNHQEYYRKNREEALRRSRKRRAKKKTVHSVSYTTDEAKTLKETFDCCCAYCGAKKPLALDHFLPISYGGSDCLGNLLPVCKSCNSSKHNYDPQKWYKSQSFYSDERWHKILSVLGKNESNYNQLPLF